MKDYVFPLSDDGKKAKIEFKTYRFLLYSHKEGVKPISLLKKEMNLLCEKLPILLKEMEILMKSVEDQSDNESNSPIKKRKIVSDDDDDDVNDHNDSRRQSIDKKPLENKIWKSFSISAYKQYETKLYLSTYDEKPFIWLRLFFDVNHDSKGSDSKKKRKRDMKPCKGGIIFNDVNPEHLISFVKSV